MRLPVVEPRRGRIRAGLAAVLALSLQTAAWALPEDSRQPIRITADHATMDEGRGEAAYRGSVRITQGTLDVQGDTLTLKVDKEGALVVANGTLLDDEWCAFFKEHDFLVGLSVLLIVRDTSQLPAVQLLLSR